MRVRFSPPAHKIVIDLSLLADTISAMEAAIKIYEVGGSIRDFLLGVQNKDRDFCVIAKSYEDMKNYLLLRGATIYLERPEYFAIRCKLPGIGDSDFTLARREGFYSNGRQPDECFICETIEEELGRRDFTIGSMARGEDGVIIDPYGGQQDVKDKILRCVGDTYERFEEDYLRMMRAVRFHITKGFALHYDIQDALLDQCLVIQLTKISRERIYEELRKCFEFDTKKTLDFFREFEYLEQVIFDHCKIKLEPKI